jgi:hypothetical protein
MGCGTTSNIASDKRISPMMVRTNQGKYLHTMKVKHPDTAAVVAFEVELEYDELPLSRVMNSLSFHESQGEQFDANFISVYNNDQDLFEYYVQRLIGVEITEEKQPLRGKMWVPYINGVKMLWNEVCLVDKRVKYNDDVVWEFHSASDYPNPLIDAPSPKP